jgi:CID domain
LYVINDVLYHATNTFRDSKSFVASAMVQYLPALVNSVRSAPSARTETLDKVLKLWSEKQYFSTDELARITGEPVKEITTEIEEKQPERKPLVKPKMLGVNGDPHWLLPVSCMLEVMVLHPLFG